MKKALVEPSGRVAQVELPANIFPVAPPLVWRDCPDDTTALHTWNGASFDPPAPPRQPDPNMVNAVEGAKRARAAEIEEFGRRMRLGASQDEINRSILELLKE